MRFSTGCAWAFGVVLAAAVPQSVSAQQRDLGPKFCQTGEGHPRFGREWCVDHNFPLGTTSTRQRWEQRNDWDDVTITTPRQRNITRVGSTQLAQIIGANGMRRLQLQAQSAGLTRPLVGQWTRDTSGHAVLMVTSGGTSIAQIVDTNADGKIDRLFLMRP